MRLLEHLPVLIVILPLIAAPLCIIVRHSTLSWWITFVVSGILVCLSVLLFMQTQHGDVIRYALGGWAAPTGIEYYIDTLNSLLVLLISIISLVTVVYAKRSVSAEIVQPRHYLFYTGWLLCLTGLLGIVVTGDAFNVFVFLEISSLAMYMLIALGKERKQALLAAFRYLMMGSIGASFILLGIGFLYAATGTLNMSDLAQQLNEVNDSRTVIVAFSFITLGLLIKAAVFPVYAWLPNAYQYAPTAVTAFLSGTATKVSLYVFLRFFFHVFGVDYSFGEMLVGKLLMPLAVIGFFVMSIVAIFQTDIRRLLAYSSLAQIGYIFVAISLSTEIGVTAGIIHMINHSLIKTALFISVGCIAYRIGSTHIHDMSLLIRSMPFTVSGFIIAGLSLIGVPLTAGFVSKWYLISAAFISGWWIIAVMILLSSLMAIIYIGKVVEICCFRRANSEPIDTQEAPLMMLIPLWVLISISLYIGLQGEFVVNWSQQAAVQLLEAMQ